MNAIIEWLNSNEPCTPAQTVAVVCAFIVLMLSSFAVLMLVTRRKRREDDVGDDSGYCGTCCHCDGVDEERDVCICRFNDPHADWRYRDNERCPEWEA